MGVREAAHFPGENTSQTYLKSFRSARLSGLVGRIAEDGRAAAGIAISVDKGGPFDAIAALPFDRETGIGLLQMNRFGVAVPGRSGRKLIGDVEQPGISGIGGKQDDLTDGRYASVVIGGFVLDVANLVGEAEALALHHVSCRTALNGLFPRDQEVLTEE